MVPPMQDGWSRARERTISTLVRWLNNVTAGGGTQPMSAFQRVFELETRPDVIFFLTDGEIPRETATRVADLNSRGKRVVINTIAFGDSTSLEQLKQIAIDSGGQCREVHAGTN